MPSKQTGCHDGVIGPIARHRVGSCTEEEEEEEEKLVIDLVTLDQ